MTVANSSGLFIVADRNRKTEFEIAIGEADGDDVVVASNDNVRVKIGRAGSDTPILEIESDEPTSNGSSCTAANPTVLVLAQGDVTFQAGVYDIEVCIVDVSDGDAIKKAELGIFVLRESMGGAVTP